MSSNPHAALPDLAAPIVAAPMAGPPSTPELVAAVSAAGGFGFLAAGYRTASAMSEQIARTRELTDRPFGMNLFTPQEQRGDLLRAEIGAYRDLVARTAASYGIEPGQPAFNDDSFAAKIAALLADPVSLVTFTFGPVPAEVVDHLRDVGTTVGFTVTDADEARQAVRLGADLLVAQGAGAGGHRGTWRIADEPNTLSAAEVVRAVRSVSDLPVIGTGGVATRADVRAILDAGAQAVAVGTLFVASDESGVPEVQKAAYTSGQFAETALTRAFSGRYARGLANDFIVRHDPAAPAAYPELHYVTSPIRAAAAKAGDPQAMALWGGIGFAAAKRRPAADIVAALVP